MRFIGCTIQFAIIVGTYYIAGYILPQFIVNCFTWIAHLFLCFNLGFWILELSQNHIFTEKVDPINKAVFITGCDSGFGNATAKILDKRGYTVFAGVLDPKSEGAIYLEETCSRKLKVVQVDVTNDESVNHALKTIQNNLGTSELWAIINNAGVLRGFQTELSTMKDYEMCMQVNALGVVRVTKAFLPLLRRSRGRVVNICSIAGRLRGPYMGAYMMSKSAAVAFTEVLMHEVRKFGIRVISIEPEFFGTPMCSEEYVKNVLSESCSEMSEEIKDAYGQSYIEISQKFLWFIFSSRSSDVKRVYDVIESAVSLQNPADLYKPARNIYLKILYMLGERVPRVFVEITVMIIFFFVGVPTPKTGISNFARILKL